MIHGRMQKYITKIARQSGRGPRLAIYRENSNVHIQIITTYAPHNGHTEEGRQKHWGEVKEIANKTCKRQMILRRTDENGKIGRGGEKKAKDP